MVSPDSPAPYSVRPAPSYAHIAVLTLVGGHISRLYTAVLKGFGKAAKHVVMTELRPPTPRTHVLMS